MFVSEVWEVNVQNEYAKEAFAAIMKLVLSDRPLLSLQNTKFVATQTESDQFKMICCLDQNTKHYHTVVVCNHVYPADIIFTEGRKIILILLTQVRVIILLIWELYLMKTFEDFSIIICSQMMLLRISTSTGENTLLSVSRNQPRKSWQHFKDS